MPSPDELPADIAQAGATTVSTSGMGDAVLKELDRSAA